MAPSSLRRAIGAVKDQTSISIAKVSSSTSRSELDVAIVKATRHEEFPTEEKYIREILSLTCYSRAHICACVNTLSRRLSKTRTWTVALKTLILIQRLLAEGDPAYKQEIFFSTRRGTRLLNMSDFRDNTKSNSWDFSAFVRTYALYLDERLEYKMQSRRERHSTFRYDEEDEENEETSKATPVSEMASEALFSRIQHLQQLLERFLACRPTGQAKMHRIVAMALYPIVTESFHIYYDITETMGILIDSFTEMEVRDCVKVYETLCRVGKQFDELDMFYGWCKNAGIGRSSEYPEVERITPKKLEVMEEYIREKSDESKYKKAKPQEEKNEAVENVKKPEPEQDMNSIKALPAPEEHKESPPKEMVKEETKQENPKQETIATQEMGDLLNLGDDEPVRECTENLALVLFDGSGPATGPSPPPPAWDAFNDGKADWETALVQSASHLPHQKASMGGGFDMLLLDGMYKQGETSAAMTGPGYGVTGSASSIALGSAGRPAMLALPAPTMPNGASSRSADPFAASLAVAPPPSVQMSELEKKQRLLMEEQLMWQQYAGNRMQGQLGIAKFQHNPTGGYPQIYGNYRY